MMQQKVSQSYRPCEACYMYILPRQVYYLTARQQSICIFCYKDLEAADKKAFKGVEHYECEFCGQKLTGNPAIFQTQTACQLCFGTLKRREKLAFHKL